MKVLVACEESQRVCTAFREKGHEAYSCDILECSGGHTEWHINANMIPLLNGFCRFKTMDGDYHEVDGKWDMILAFVPCTKTSNAGARHLYKGGKLNLQRFYDGLCGKALFLTVWNADCDKIVIENPLPSKIFDYPEPTQKIQPWMFGDPYTKCTLLWEKGVQQLVPMNIVKPVGPYCPSGTSRKIKDKYGFAKRGDDAKNRAKTFPGIAKAMAEQWG